MFKWQRQEDLVYELEKEEKLKEKKEDLKKKKKGNQWVVEDCTKYCKSHNNRNRYQSLTFRESLCEG